MNLKDFSLLKEDNDNYTIGHPKGNSMTIPKRGLSDKAQTLISQLKREQHLAGGGDTSEDTEGLTIPVSSTPTPLPDSMLNPNVVASNAPTGDQPSTQPSVTSDAEQGTVPAPDTSQSAPPPPMASPDLQNAMKEAVGSIQKGTQAESKAGRQEAAAQEELAHKLQAQPSSDEIFNKYQNKDQQLEKAFVSKQIDPERYLNNMSTGSKIASSIGLILSGFGSALTGQHNLAQENINRAIANDIDAQKNDQSKAMNLWKMNREQLGDENQANLATQNQLLNVAKAKMMQAQAGAMGPVAQQNAANAVLGINQQIATNNWMRSRLSGGAPGSEQQHISEMQVMQQVRPDFYKDMESKYLPGVGTTRIAVTPSDKESFRAYDEMQKAVNDAKAFQAEVGTVIPFTANAATAEGKKQAIALAMNKLNGLNRLNETELHAFQGMIDGIGGFRTSRTNAQLDELTNQIQRKKNTEMQALGVQPFRQSGSNQQAIAWARANPTDPRARQVLQLASQ